MKTPEEIAAEVTDEWLSDTSVPLRARIAAAIRGARNEALEQAARAVEPDPAWGARAAERIRALKDRTT